MPCRLAQNVSERRSDSSPGFESVYELLEGESYLGWSSLSLKPMLEARNSERTATSAPEEQDDQAKPKTGALEGSALHEKRRRVQVIQRLSLVLLVASALGVSPVGARAQTSQVAQTAKTDTASAADLAGDWQVAFAGPGDGTRVVFRISKAPAGWRAMVYWIDQKHYPASVSTVVSHGDAVSFLATAYDLNGSFSGTVAPDHATIAGKWTQGNGGKNGFATQLVTLTRAVKGSAWEIPPALGADAKIIAADLDPTFEVATVKPHDPNVQGGGWRWIDARRFEATMPVAALLADIYGLQRDQILGGPGWMFKDVYDYAGVPDLPGWPTLEQRYNMERKLIQERFGLKVHTETRDMSAMVLTTVKGGSRMAPSVMVDPGVTFTMHPGASGGGFVFTGQNASMGDFKRVLQNFVEKPVIDRTGLTGQFDFDLKFMPDESLFGGRVHLPPADSGTPPPELYTAMQEQLGLKLTPYKGPVEVLVIDHIERPSPN